MTTIYFVRHAQPDYTSGTQSTFDLSDEGKEDRFAAAAILRDIRFKAAVSSPYKRSLETIRPIAESQGLEIRTDIRLRERDSGIKGNSSHEMFRKRWADHNYCEEGGECLCSVERRNIEALEDILEKYSGSDVLVGTHGTALSVILNHYDKAFGVEEFLRVINYMPWVVRADFDEKELVSYKELGFVRKEFHGKTK